VRDACFGVGCQVGLHCEAGACVADVRPDAGTGDGGTGFDASSMDGSHGDAARDGSDGGTGTMHAGCGCHTPGEQASDRTSRVFVALLLAAGVISTRRRRNQR